MAVENKEIKLWNLRKGKMVTVDVYALEDWSDYVPAGAALNLYQLLILQDGFTPKNAALYVLKLSARGVND